MILRAPTCNSVGAFDTIQAVYVRFPDDANTEDQTEKDRPKAVFLVQCAGATIDRDQTYLAQTDYS